MLTQAGKSICKKILPIDANTVKTTFNSKAAIRLYNPAFSLNVVKGSPKLPNDQCRASVITGKKALGKSAVIRNRARRRIISSARLCFPKYATPGKIKRNAFSFCRTREKWDFLFYLNHDTHACTSFFFKRCADTFGSQVMIICFLHSQKQ